MIAALTASERPPLSLSITRRRGWLAERHTPRTARVRDLDVLLERLGVDVSKPAKMPHRGLEDAAIELDQWRKARAAVRLR